VLIRRCEGENPPLFVFSPCAEKRGPSWVEPTVGSSVSPLGCTQVRKMTPDAEVLRYDCSSYPRCMTIRPELAPNLQELFGGSPRSPRTHSERFQEGLHGSRR